MNKTPWKPWRDVVALREDVRSGELALKIFAADLYDVAMDQGPAVYRDPAEFFALTYPTFALRDLTRDVLLRLAGRSDKAIRQLELTYGGGKTHTLIALYHLTNHPEQLPDLPSVGEFVNHSGIRPPRAQVAVLAFDKLDVEKGMQIGGPNGTTRWLRHPWSVLAYQIAGDDGLRLLHPEERAEERDSAPAENLLTDLLRIPARDGLATLVLIDEVLMYAREKVGQDDTWLGKLANFFQYLTQAAGKVDRCAIVASLLATDPARGDALGRRVLADLQTIFMREQEQSVQPVGKDDVAEVLRRRFFTPDSIRDLGAFRPHVMAALDGIKALDEQTRREGTLAEDRFLRSYPFHPDLTDVFYTKWTNLERFQRTRGILRTFALALREAARWDDSPLVAANVFLTAAGDAGIGEATRELAGAALTDEGAGSRQQWSVILESELSKARDVQAEHPALHQREIEQAVMATFLHSQPSTQKARTRDLLLLLGPARPDRITLEKGLRRWTEISWYLDENAVAGDTAAGSQLPGSWRLGSKPNLRQIHHEACTRVVNLVSGELLKAIGECKPLTSGAASAGLSVHMLPQAPNEVADDGRFHYAVLGPGAVSDSGRPSAEAVRFLVETTGPERPRANKNAVVLAVPSREGLGVARAAVHDYLGWLEVPRMLVGEPHGDGKAADPLRERLLKDHTDAAKRAVPDAVRQAYSVVIAYNERGEASAFKLQPSMEPLFAQIKADARSRIQDERIEADALLPGGPFNVWREDEPTRWVKDLVGAFAQNPALPRLLKRQAILETIAAACRDGAIVLRQQRPDRSQRTFWHEDVDVTIMDDPTLEAVLPESATLSALAPTLLAPGELPALWHGDALLVADVYAYFSGTQVVQVDRGGFEEPRAIPATARPAVEEAIQAAVRAGQISLISGTVAFYKEEVPEGVITADSQLATPPVVIPVLDLLPQNLPEGWGRTVSGRGPLAEGPDPDPTTARRLAEALERKAGRPLPWSVVRTAIGGALAAGYLSLAPGSAPWPVDAVRADTVRLVVPTITPPPPPPTVLRARARLESHQIQSLAESLDDVVSAAGDHDLQFTFQIDADASLPKEVVDEINRVLKDVSSSLVLRPQDA